MNGKGGIVLVTLLLGAAGGLLVGKVLFRNLNVDSQMALEELARGVAQDQQIQELKDRLT